MYSKIKIIIFLSIVFISFTIVAFNIDGVERIGGTQLNGNGCVCHTTEESPDVHVWIEGPDTMIAGHTSNYKMYMFGGPAIAGGYNVAVYFGLLGLTDSLSLLIDNELTQSFPLPFNSVTDTIFWEFSYTAPDSVELDTLYSVGLSTNWDSIPDDRDQWAYGQKFLVHIINNTIPVELTAFDAEILSSNVQLTWQTASEKNNKGFEIERKVLHQKSSISENEFEKIGFVEGKGTSTIIQNYFFIDNEVRNGKYIYRLKQLDFDGSFSFSDELEVEVNVVQSEFKLYQNYPNPFNPSTKIQFSLSSDSHVSLKVYEILGNEFLTLVDEFKKAGKYEVDFSIENLKNIRSSSSNLSSGIYFYQLRCGNHSQTQKMLLIR